MRTSRIAAAALIATTLTACDKKVAHDPPARPVRTVTVERGADGETVSLTGQIRAKDQASLAFRLDGRMIERVANIGDVVKAGQVVARLDPQNQRNSLNSAEAGLAAVEAQLTQATLTYGRQQVLLKDGWTPRAKFDDAQQAFLTARAQVDAAQAQVRIARDQLSYTVLVADAPGAVTSVGAESGEVIRAGQMVVQVAREGPRDAVFDVSEQVMRTAPRDPAVEITLTDNPRVTAVGRLREIAPQADTATRTFQVKVGMIDPPAGMRLGSTVTGRVRLSTPTGITLPASALTQLNGQPAVWVVNPHSLTVSLRGVEVLRFDPATIVIAKGLETGESVVTAGVQKLYPDEKVRLLGDAS